MGGERLSTILRTIDARSLPMRVVKEIERRGLTLNRFTRCTTSSESNTAGDSMS